MRRLLLALYPPSWRSEYGDEFSDVLDHERLTVRVVVDVLVGATDAWLTPGFRSLPPWWNRRTLRLGSGLAFLLAVLSGGVSALHSTPAQASPRFPVYVAISRQIYPAVTVNVTNLGRPIPHLVLFAQFSRYQISSVQSWRAGRSGPMRVLAAQAIPHHGAGRILDLGRLPSGASVTVTYYLSRKQVAMFGPGPLTYTIRGYGTLRRDGRPDYSAVLSGTPSHFGSGALPQVQREPVCGGDNLMHMTLSKYQLQGSGTITFGSGSVLTQTLLNCGKSIEHLVISIRLKYAPRDGIVHIRAVRHAGTLETTQQPVWLRGASTKEATVYDLGMLPSASEIRVTVATSSGSSSSGDVIRVYARLSRNGQPDPRSLVFSGTDTWRQG